MRAGASRSVRLATFPFSDLARAEWIVAAAALGQTATFVALLAAWAFVVLRTGSNVLARWRTGPGGG